LCERLMKHEAICVAAFAGGASEAKEAAKAIPRTAVLTTMPDVVWNIEHFWPPDTCASGLQCTLQPTVPVFGGFAKYF